MNWGFISQKTPFFIVTAVETSNLECGSIRVVDLIWPYTEDVAVIFLDSVAVKRTSSLRFAPISRDFKGYQGLTQRSYSLQDNRSYGKI
jgi:hypothetical protein